MPRRYMPPRGPSRGHYPPRRRREPELPWPREGDVFWIFFWVMLPLLIFEAWWCSRRPEPEEPEPAPIPVPTYTRGDDFRTG
jgi:hypothetical protein